jgi:ElaB/YqjD/DUF883 family membrane-anchored ribosome-binding protein
MDQDTETGYETGSTEEPSGTRRRMDQAREYVGSKYAQAKDRAEEIDIPEMMDQVRTYVRSNPGKALLMSIGAGFLVGLLLRRRDED